jgi:hypothetical protein
MTEHNVGELLWLLEKLAQQGGWTNEEILEAAKLRAKKTRGRPRLTDEDSIARIIAGRATAGKIAGGNDSDRRRLAAKAQKKTLLDRYHAQLEELVLLALQGISVPQELLSDWICRDTADRVLQADLYAVVISYVAYIVYALGLAGLGHDPRIREEVEKVLFLLFEFESPVIKGTIANLEEILCELRAKAGEKSE